jgi:hypothetical protein
MMVEVIATDEFAQWYGALDDTDTVAVRSAVSVLEEKGVALEFPRSSQIKGSEFALRELRIQSKGRPLRVFYAFDSVRNAVLIIGGDKTGNDRFYEEMVPRAEKIWKQYLAEQKSKEE